MTGLGSEFTGKANKIEKDQIDLCILEHGNSRHTVVKGDQATPVCELKAHYFSTKK